MIKIKIDSRKVKQGDTFVAIRGNNVDGHDFVMDAIKNGATTVVVEKDILVNVKKIIVRDTNKWLIEEVSNKYQDKVNEISIIGVTGTNGKTTSCYLTYQILNLLKVKAAYIGTIGFYIPGENIIPISNTTPNILDLYELILKAKNKGCKYVVMEVSSHALDMERVKGLKFKVGVFTNLTIDHLDYHADMESYFKAKQKIIKQITNTLIVNGDDKYSERLEYSNKKTIGYSGCDYKIINYSDTSSGSSIELIYDDKTYKINTNLKGEFNVYNYITSLAIISELGYSIEDIIRVTTNVYPPKGRCEQIKINDGYAIIDYAHTPDAVEKIINIFQKNKRGKIITVIGCGGDRDAKKRPIMGKIATENSDYVVFTSDNPRTEDANLILEDIIKEVTKDNYTIMPDRGEAIKKALNLIKGEDIVLILGKGHENYQIIGIVKHHFDDKEEVMKYLEK